jgi:type II secretory pathway component PulC
MINENIQQRAAILISTLVAVLLLYTLIQTLGQWRHDWSLAHQTIPVPVSVAPDKTAEMITALPEAHLFGLHTGLSKLGDIPITSLELRITGIVKIATEQNNTLSKALISIAGQPSKIYQVGDRLPMGVKVYAITPDAVVLENDSRLEKLPLPRKKVEFRAPSKEYL